MTHVDFICVNLLSYFPPHAYLHLQKQTHHLEKDLTQVQLLSLFSVSIYDMKPFFWRFLWRDCNQAYIQKDVDTRTPFGVQPETFHFLLSHRSPPILKLGSCLWNAHLHTPHTFRFSYSILLCSVNFFFVFCTDGRQKLLVFSSTDSALIDALFCICSSEFDWITDEDKTVQLRCNRAINNISVLCMCVSPLV